MTSDAIEGMKGARADASQLRVVLDTSHVLEMDDGATLAPTRRVLPVPL